MSRFCVVFRYSLGDIRMILIKQRLKLETEWKPTASEMSRMESSVLCRRLQALEILVRLRKSSGEMCMMSRNTLRKWVGLQRHKSAK